MPNAQQPQLVYTVLPEDPEVRSDLLLSVIETGKDVEWRPEYYQPYQPDQAQLRELRQRSLNVEQIAAADIEAKQAINKFLHDNNGELNDYIYMPLVGKNKDIIIVLSYETGLPVGHVSISPWLSDYQVAQGAAKAVRNETMLGNAAPDTTPVSDLETAQ